MRGALSAHARGGANPVPRNPVVLQGYTHAIRQTHRSSHAVTTRNRSSSTKTPASRSSSPSTPTTGARARTAAKKAPARKAPAKKLAAPKLARGDDAIAKKGTLVRVATRKVGAAPAKRARSANAPAAPADLRPARAPRKSAGSQRASNAARTATQPAAPVKARDALPKRGRVAAPVAPAELLRNAVRHALEELKARDMVEIDVREKTSVCDWFVIVSGTSSRHVKSLADEVIKAAKGLKMPPLGVEGAREGEWIVVDLGDLVVHLMQPRVREFYALEKLWGVAGTAVAGSAALS